MKRASIPNTRPAFVRLRFIANQVRTKEEIPNTYQLAKRWECSYKTISRDFETLRDFFDYPIAYNPQKYCWQKLGPVPEAVL